ncbi:MAG: thiolase C-terminal domain-containing protein [Promethearchaeota archaeon]
MGKKVAILGLGHTAFNSITPDMGWKDFMYEACNKAYVDAGVNPRTDVDSFITCAEDFYEGFSIFDEFVPDQVGALLKPCCTVCGDGIYGLGTAYMQIKTGYFDMVSIEAHSKISDLLTYGEILNFGMDPVFERPVVGSAERPNYKEGPVWPKGSHDYMVGKSDEKERVHPYFLAGMEMQHYLKKTGTTEEQCAGVVVKNKKNAFFNPYADYELKLTVDDVMKSDPVFTPMKYYDVAPTVDGAICFVLGTEEKAKELGIEPIYLDGFGWSSETPWFSNRGFDAKYATMSSKMAYKMAGIKDPKKEIDILEVDDKYSYKELQHLEAIGYTENAAKMLDEGKLTNVNVSGGALGVGNCLEATGLQKSLEIVTQLRGHAGKRQLSDLNVGLAQSWRGLPSPSGAVAIFRRG